MFVLSEIKTTVIINPRDFDKNLSEVCERELNRKLANTILHNVGLCMCFHELVSIGDSTLTPTEGSSYTDVTFRLVVFRPEIGSIITGRIRSCESSGVYITLGFFDDIFIPEHKLQYPSRYSEADKAWIWEYPLENGAKHDFFMDVGEVIKFRVFDEQFIEHEPLGPPGSERARQNLQPSYIILGSINENGLGIESWWAENYNEEEEHDSGSM